MDTPFLAPLLVVLLIPFYAQFLRRRYPPPVEYRESDRLGVRVGVRLVWAIAMSSILVGIFGSFFALLYLNIGPRLDIGLLMIVGTYVLGELLALSIARLCGRQFQVAYINYYQHRLGANLHGIRFNIAVGVLGFILLAAFVHLRSN